MTNPLASALPPGVRKALYAVLFVAALVFSIYQASNGDWLVFTGSLITALLGLLAASNTPTQYAGTIDPYLAEATTSREALHIPEMQKRLGIGYESPKVDAKEILLKVEQPDFE